MGRPDRKGTGHFNIQMISDENQLWYETHLDV